MVAGDLEAPVLAVVGSSAQASPVDDVVLVALTSGILGVDHKLLAPARRARLYKLKTKSHADQNQTFLKLFQLKFDPV